jgi:hypothetical protein
MGFFSYDPPPPVPEYPVSVPRDVSQLFEQLTFYVRQQGFERYSSDAILHQIRWEYQVVRGHRDFKCNNDWTATLSRWFMKKHPEMTGFFETRICKRGNEFDDTPIKRPAPVSAEDSDGPL